MNFTEGIMLQSILFVLNDTNLPGELQSKIKPNISETTRCYGIYGCYSLEYPWMTEKRPVAFFPAEPDELKVRYPTFTRYNLKIPYFLDPNEPDQIISRKFNAKGPFFFIAHGYLEGGDKPWIQEMAETLLSLNQNVDGTVIAIDWREASSPPYTQAVANIRLLGTITAYIINDLYVHLKLKNLDNFHFIGHSLGAHLGGYVGAALQKEFGLKMGRITGLDPAEPLFKEVEDIVRLERSDAKYVDVIHTDCLPFISGGLGLVEAIGHVDFYPNGGLNQPGCSHGMMNYVKTSDGSMFRGLRKYLGCNHMRSYEYFIESILTKCPFLSIVCPTYNDFEVGSCFECSRDGQSCLRFGYHSNLGYMRLRNSGEASANQSVVSFLLTGDSAPFCRMHYRVTINISSSVESAAHGGDVGRLWLTLISINGTESEKIPLDDSPGSHKPGSQRTIMVSSKDLGVPMSVKVEFEFETNLLNPLTWRILVSPRIYLAWIHIESLEYKKSLTVCPPNELAAIANTPLNFETSDCKNIFPIKIPTKIVTGNL